MDGLLSLHAGHRTRLAYEVVRLSQPAVEPVSVDEIKADRRILSDTSEDTLIADRISAAREWCENRQGRSYISSNWRLLLDRFPNGSRPIRLPRPNTIEVTAFEQHTGSAWEAVAPAGYRARTDGEIGMIHPVNHWPTLSSDLRPGEWAVKVEFTAGYGDAAADVPQNIKQAIMLLVAHWFENREPQVTGTIATKLQWSLDSLLAQNPAHWSQP